MAYTLSGTYAGVCNCAGLCPCPVDGAPTAPGGECTGVLIFCMIGAYSLKQTLFDVWVMLGFGILGYLLRKLDFPIAPAILALILGPMMERSLRTTLEMSGGSFAIFLDRPVALGLLTVPVIVLGALLLRPGTFSKLRVSDVD